MSGLSWGSPDSFEPNERPEPPALPADVQATLATLQGIAAAPPAGEGPERRRPSMEALFSGLLVLGRSAPGLVADAQARLRASAKTLRSSGKDPEDAIANIAARGAAQALAHPAWGELADHWARELARYGELPAETQERYRVALNQRRIGLALAEAFDHLEGVTRVLIAFGGCCRRVGGAIGAGAGDVASPNGQAARVLMALADAADRLTLGLATASDSGAVL